MKIVTLVLGLIISFTSCKVNSQPTKNDLHIPDSVNINKSKNYTQIPGTRIFIIKPKGYKLISSLARFQKDNNTYIQAVELPSINFLSTVAKIKQKFDSIESEGAIIYYQKAFQLGNYNAYLIYVPSDKPDINEILLYFGDNEFTVMVVGVFLKNDLESKDEVLSSLLTTYFNPNAQPDYSAFPKYTIDLSKSQFKFNKRVSNISYYTINGEGSAMMGSSENEIMVVQMPPMNNYDERKNYAQNIFNNMKNRGLVTENFEDNEIKIGGLNSYEMTFAGTIKGSSIKGYEVVLGNEKTTLLFVGLAYSLQDKLLNDFKYIASSIEIK